MVGRRYLKFFAAYCRMFGRVRGMYSASLLVTQICFIQIAIAQPDFNEEFNSNGGGEEFHSSGGNFWQSHEARYPACAGLIEQHYQLTQQIRETAESGRYLTGRARTENGRKVNALAKQRNQLMRQIQSCEGDSAHKRRKPPLSGGVQTDDNPPSAEISATPPLRPDRPQPARTPQSNRPPYPIEIQTRVPTPQPRNPVAPVLPVSQQPTPTPTEPQKTTPIPGQTLQPTPTPRGTPLQGRVEKRSNSDEDEDEDEKGTPTPNKETPLCVFHYFYINGMNTPYEIPAATRGDYKEEYGLVFQNLVQYMADQFDPLKERHYIMRPTPNQSGLDPHSGTDPLVVAGCIAITPPADRWRCLMSEVSNCIRRGDDQLTVDGKVYPGDAPTGDMIEVLRQGLNFAGQGIEFSAKTELVQDIVSQMRLIRERAGNASSEKHFFIVVAHSQGNFFAESIPWNLRDQDPALLPDMGIFGIGSPTNYQRIMSLIQPQQVVINTRADDLILTLNRPLHNAFPAVNGVADVLAEQLQNLGAATVPGLPTLPPLFPDRRPLLDTFSGPSPTVSFPAAVDKCIKLSRGDHSPTQVPDGDQVPLLDSHLLTNYLNDPPPNGGTPVLEAMRYNLVKLTDNFCPHDHWPKLRPSSAPADGDDDIQSTPSPTETPPTQPVSRAYRLRIWLNAFIPNDLRALNLWGQTHKNVDGRTYVLGPDTLGYATDQRGFSPDHTASARFHSEALLEVDAQGNAHLVQTESHCTPTQAINILSGKTVCEKPAEHCGQMSMTPLRSPGNIFVMELKAFPTNPCVAVLGMNPSPPISVDATFQVMTKQRKVLMTADLSQFPAFEAYVQVETADGTASVAAPIFQKLPVKEKSPIDLYRGVTEKVYDVEAHY
jgi:hypothetical protein